MVASVFGSLVGLGGGFVVIPLLRVAFGVPPAQAAGTSLLLVFANTAAATVGYLRDRVVDLRLAVPLTVSAVPGSIAGVLAVKRFSADRLRRRLRRVSADRARHSRHRAAAGMTSRPADERTFAHDPRVGLAAGFGVGFFSSLFGIGGGVVLIPLLLIVARMPPHVVTATSAFVITTTAPVGIVAHALGGDVDWMFSLPLLLGGIVGGSLGPPIAKRVSSPNLITLLATALILAAVSLAVRHFF